jgi:nucleoside-diphosphate-sugar epimerase
VNCLVYYVQVSGASALAAPEVANPSYEPGSASEIVYDDLSDVSDLVKVLRAHPFRAVDDYILDVHAKSPTVNTALVFPPIIYGPGEGPINQRSIQIPDLSKLTLEKGTGFQVGAGLSRWGNIHVRDLGRIFSGLAGAAAAKEGEGKLWNENGVFLTGIRELVSTLIPFLGLVLSNRFVQSFKEISQKIAHEAVKQGFNTNEEIKVLQKPEADKLLHFGSIMFGTNARSKPRRAAEYLAWAPKEASLEEEIPRVIADEAKKLGK